MVEKAVLPAGSGSVIRLAPQLLQALEIKGLAGLACGLPDLQLAALIPPAVFDLVEGDVTRRDQVAAGLALAPFFPRSMFANSISKMAP